MRGSNGRPRRIRGLAGARPRLALLAALIVGGLGWLGRPAWMAGLGLWRSGQLVDAAVASGAVATATVAPGAAAMFLPPSLRAYADGHARPRALAVDAHGDRLYVAASTADRLFVVDLRGPHPRLEDSLPLCAFPDALAPLPTGGVVVSCRFDPSLRVVIPRPDAAGAAAATFDVRAVSTGAEHGNRGLAVDPSGRFAYVGSPARGGVKIVALAGSSPASAATAPRFIATGLSPQSVRFVAADPPLRRGPLLLVANFIGHTVGVYPVLPDGGLAPAVQTIHTAAPVLDLAVLPAAIQSGSPGPAGAPGGAWRGALLLATHEDRELSRAHLAVEGLDSVLLVLPAAAPGASVPFVDAGAGRRLALNLSERTQDPVVGLDALAVDPRTGHVAVVGAGSDDVVLAAPTALVDAPAALVGNNPSAVAFLPSGGVVTADRLGDTLSFVAPSGVAPSGGSATDLAAVLARSPARAAAEVIAVGRPERPTPAERGEVMFYSRALVPHNVATGPLSLYTCAGCHPDGHVDGRRHPSKRNRFYSMTKTCRGLLGTEPFLSIGEPDTFAAFADNILATHAQGALDAPASYDQYPVSLRLREGERYATVTLSPQETRAALAAYLPRIPVEPSPFAPPQRWSLATDQRRGLALFRDRCSGCHQLLPATGADHGPPPSALEPLLRDARLVLTSALRYDVGTPVLGEGGNCPPSLRGVWSAAPYFSDGSAATIEDVLRRTDPAAAAVHAPANALRSAALSSTERAALAAFLRLL